MIEKRLELPFGESYWVVPEQFLAGEFPGVQDVQQTRRRIDQLLGLGINLIIDLTEEGEHPSYTALLEQAADELEQTVTYWRSPIPDFFVPTVFVMKDILDRIDRTIENCGRVYMHCLAGIGRTGTVVGCYLVRHGMRGPVALEYLAQLRRNLPSWWKVSPESSLQREFINSWQMGT